MNKERLKTLLENTKALEDAMKFIYRTSNQDDLFPFSNYKTFMRKYNQIALEAYKEIKGEPLYDIYDLDKVKYWADSLRPEQKMYFDEIIGNIAILRSTLENKLDVKSEEIMNLKNFLVSNLRKAVLHEPQKEIDIQDSIEQIFIGKGFTKGTDYDREVGRVKVSIKEYKPDFIFPKLDLALEVKFSKTVAKSKEIIDEINADITAYGKKYSQLLFVVYDMGTIPFQPDKSLDTKLRESLNL